MDYKTIHKSNENFRKYVDKYCRTYHLLVEEALTHKLVQEVAREYEEGQDDERDIIPRKEH